MVTRTKTKNIPVPYYTTTTEYVQQDRAVDITSHVVEIEESVYPIYLTDVSTVAATVNVPVTVVQKSGVPVPRERLLLNTAVEYVTVTHTKPAYDYQNDIAYVTKDVVENIPSYVTKTQYKTAYVTHTSYVNVPTYSTVYEPCNSYY